MKIEFISKSATRTKGKRPTMTLQKAGKLSVNQAARLLFDIDQNTYFKFGLNTENPEDKSLYLLKCAEGEAEAYKVQKSGNQMHLNVNYAIAKLGLDYKNKKHSVEATNEVIDGKKFIKVSFKEINN